MGDRPPVYLHERRPELIAVHVTGDRLEADDLVRMARRAGESARRYQRTVKADGARAIVYVVVCRAAV